jgi:hypothetical protein
MTRRLEYRQYLKSTEWQDKRSVALMRTSGACQYCGDLAQHVHHVRYPKMFGDEHPDSLIPVCGRCHKTSHGIQEMKPLTNVKMMREFAPEGGHFGYLVSEGRVYASAKSWRRALQVPESLTAWFDARLSVNALYKKGSSGDEMQRSYDAVPVYRWRVVAMSLRNFDHQFQNHGFKSRSVQERIEREKFHERYERLVEWGDDLQERAMVSALRKRQAPDAPANTAISEARLVAVVSQAVAPRFEAQERREQRQDVMIREVKEAVPALQPGDVFITVKRAIAEKGLDATIMPLHPKSNETLSGLAGQMLVARGAAKGTPEVARLDGTTRATAVNTYKRADIYAVLDDIMRSKPQPLI